MDKEEFDFVLFDRIEKIKQINEQLDLEKNSYIAYSGGKDSTVLSYLIDLALPNNTIPRVFANTGLEFNEMVKYVKKMALSDERVVILKQTKNIKQTLEKYGYPFKAKGYSEKLSLFNRHKSINTINNFLNPKKKTKFKCPDVLKYQFQEENKFHFSDKCCTKLKKEMQFKWQKANKKTIGITGVRKEEGGNRQKIGCLTRNNTLFHPLSVVNDEWEEMFINEFGIELCRLYYPPFNFKRTGCKGCPFAPNLLEDLRRMKEYLPHEYKQCLKLWKPVYDEYDRIGYRLSYNMLNQMSLFDFIDEQEQIEGRG